MDLPERSPFDPSLDEMQAIGAAAVVFASRFVDERYTAAASDYDDLDSLLSDLTEPPPRGGIPLSRLLATIETAAGKGFDTANPALSATYLAEACTPPRSVTSSRASSIATPALPSRLRHSCGSRRPC